MKAADFSGVLHALSEFAPDEAARGALGLLASVFAGRGTLTVAAICKRLQGLTPASDGAGWSRAVLAKHLGHAQNLLAKAGAKVAAEDFKSVIACLRSAGAGGVDAWVHQAQSVLAENPVRRKSSPKEPKAAAVDEAVVVDEYVKRLHAAGWDQAMFNATVEAIKADKAAKVGAVRRIGAEFAKLNAVKMTKPKILVALRDDFVSRLRTRNELEVVAKTKPW